MKQGQGRFEYYLVQLESSLAQAGESSNPALWLYKNDARTCLFMLEGLAKLYSCMHDSKRFSKISTWCKELEDLIGKIDHYDHFSVLLKSRLSLPVTISAYLEGEKDKAVIALNNLLTKRKWLGPKAERTNKIRKHLGKMKWKNEEKESALIKDAFTKSIADINRFAEKTSDAFTNLEDEVHELRRKLRWLSIYAKALQGFIQLCDTLPSAEELDEYLTPGIIASPFNKMIPAGHLKYNLLLERNYFYALSWMIQKFGTLKDTGLEIYVIAEALAATENLTEEQALYITQEIAGNESDNIETILHQSHKEFQAWMKADVLDKLVVGIYKVQQN